MGKGNFRSPQNRHPSTDHQTIFHRWFCRRPQQLCQIRCTSVHSGLLGTWVKLLFLFIPFLRNSPTGQTSRRIFTRENENRAYYQSNCIDSNQILHSDKDHQMPFVVSPYTRITNPRWRTAVILEKSKNRHISAVVQAISTEFGMMMQFEPLDRSDR